MAHETAVMTAGGWSGHSYMEQWPVEYSSVAGFALSICKPRFTRTTIERTGRLEPETKMNAFYRIIMHLDCLTKRDWMESDERYATFI